MKLTAACLLILVGALPALAADSPSEAPSSPKLALATMFSDHMVLQRDMKVPIWGTAAPGAKVTVAIEKEGVINPLGSTVAAESQAAGSPSHKIATSEAVADATGLWRIDVGPIHAGGPYDVVVSSGNESRHVADVLFGDVWIASGQSNMEWNVKDCQNAQQDVAAANLPEIRGIDVPNRPMDEPQTSFDASKTWTVCAPDNVGWWPAVGFFFARELNKELKVPIGIISTNVGGTPMEAWTSREALAAVPTFADDYEQAVEQAKKKEVNAQGWPVMSPSSVPSALYNGMVAPVIPYGIKGVIWYQGEANAGRHAEYRQLSETMIADWRQRFGEGDFPFLFVQLASWEPGGEDWAYLRESQAETLSVPHTGMATAIDIGDRTDIHPKNKQEVGRRLALVARHVAYGDDSVEYSGPTYREMHADGAKLRLSFDHASGLRIRGDGDLKGFEIAGADAMYVPAKATIDGDAVTLSADGVSEPKSARYDWSSFPDGNLENDAGLPATPFRTSK